MRILLCTLLALTQITSAQHAVVADREPLPDNPPQSTAEPRRKLAVDPDAVFARIVSKDSTQSRRALEELGLSWMAEGEPTDVKLLAVNLDSDSDLERLLIVENDSEAVALVLKKEDGVWWELGNFLCGGPGGRIVDPFVELKDTVWYGTKDLIIHRGGSQGTGVGEHRLLIYRVWRSRLYKVFDIVESAYNSVQSESSSMTYPDVDSSSSSRSIIVRRTRKVQNRRTTTCMTYRWDANRFTFSQVLPNRTLCMQ
jgi:hypothetical protein